MPTDQFNIVKAAQEANRVYLNAVGATGTVRRSQEYDNLTDVGQAVWRSMIRTAMTAGSR